MLGLAKKNKSLPYEETRVYECLAMIVRVLHYGLVQGRTLCNPAMVPSLSVQAALGFVSFGAWFAEVKKARIKFVAEHDGAMPVPGWTKVVYAAAGQDVADLDGKTEEEGYEIVGPFMTAGLKVRLR